MSSSRPRRPVPVYLNIYDLSPYNTSLHQFGFGAYHSGVECYGREYSFGYQDSSASGVFDIAPRTAEGCVFREQVQLGEISLSINEFERVIANIKPKFIAREYSILTRNCNTFADELSKALLGRPIPSYINRLSKCGQCFSCFLPASITNPHGLPSAKPTGASASSSSSSSSASFSSRRSSENQSLLAAQHEASPQFVAFKGQGQSLTGDTKKGKKDRKPVEESKEDKREKMRRAALTRLSKEPKKEDPTKQLSLTSPPSTGSSVTSPPPMREEEREEDEVDTDTKPPRPDPEDQLIATLKTSDQL
jgi:hypothetical protein